MDPQDADIGADRKLESGYSFVWNSADLGTEIATLPPLISLTGCVALLIKSTVRRVELDIKEESVGREQTERCVCVFRTHTLGDNGQIAFM